MKPERLIMNYWPKACSHWFLVLVFGSVLSFQKFDFRLICLKDHGSTSDGCWDIEILKMWNAKKNISKGVPLKKKIQLKNENEKYCKLPDLARKVEKKWSKIWPPPPARKKNQKNIKSWTIAWNGEISNFIALGPTV